MLWEKYRKELLMVDSLWPGWANDGVCGEHWIPSSGTRWEMEKLSWARYKTADTRYVVLVGEG